jgi:Cu(I)-responsive transcriptional regulator
MNIGDVARRSGLPAKTIRYYEEIGLIKPLRDENGYRAFRGSDLQKLAFLARARALGFSIEDCRALLALYEDQGRTSAEVKRIALAHLRQVDEKLRALESIRGSLAVLVEACAGDLRPDCPIIDDLAAPAPPPAAAAAGD